MVKNPRLPGPSDRGVTGRLLRRLGAHPWKGTAELPYRTLLERQRHALESEPGTSPEKFTDLLLGAPQLWWKCCQEAVRKDPGWLFEHDTQDLHAWLGETVVNDRRTAGDSVYGAARALAATADLMQEQAGQLRQIAERWDQSGLLLPAALSGTGLISAKGMAAVDDNARRMLQRVIEAIRPSVGDLAGASGPALAMAALTVLLLAGAERRKHPVVRVSVVFGRSEQDTGQAVGKEQGAAGFLELREFPAGPVGLFPDPQAMAGARSSGNGFAQSLAQAWESCPWRDKGRCVLWRIILDDDRPLTSVEGASLGAAFAVALRELLRHPEAHRPSVAWLRGVFHGLRAGTAITGAITDGGQLARVGDIGAKFQAAHRKHWRLVVPEANRRDIGLAPEPAAIDFASSIKDADKYARRWRKGRISIAAGTILLLASGGASFRLYSDAGTANQNADRQQAIALSRQLAADSLTIDATDPVTARQLAVAAWRTFPTDQALLAMTSLLAEQRQAGVLLAAVSGSSAQVYGVAFSPDGKLLASASASASPHAYGTVRLWNPLTGQPTGAPLQVPGGVNGIAFSPDGKLLASADGDGTIRLWNPLTGRPTGAPLRVPGGVNGIAFSPDGKLLASADDDGTIRLWNPLTRLPLGPPLPADPSGFVWSVAFSPDGKLLATADLDDTVRLWNPITGQHVSSFRAGDLPTSGGVNGVAFSPDGKLLATADLDGTVRLWNPITGQPVSAPLAADPNAFGGVNGVAFSPDGKLLAAADADGTVRSWNVPLFVDPYSALCADVGPPTPKEWNEYAQGRPQPRVCA